MKLQTLLLGTVFALGAAQGAQAAMTTPTGWYLSLGAGANWVEDSDYTSTVGASGPFFGHKEWDMGYVIAAAVGHDFGRWRVEFEVAFRDNEEDAFCPLGSPCVPATGDLWELSQMINILYDFGLGGNWSASVGAGIGGNLVEWQSTVFTTEVDDYVLSGQLMAEVAYQLSDHSKAFLGYRYVVMEDPDFTYPVAYNLDFEKTDHSLLVGISFDLERDPGSPPAAQAGPPLRQPKQFIVFFGFNKSSLTAEADGVVANAAAAAKEYGSASIIVVGHTDTVGSNAYNNRLSMRRSQAVKDGLVARGIPVEAISTGGRGESELMVQTGDGVKEPQNRRATIDLN